jgi:transglutaminase-like putative cysteine protease
MRLNVLSKKVLWIAPLLALGGWIGASPAMPQPREVTLTYLARLPIVSGDAGQAHLWIPLAKTGQEQRILRREVRSPVPYPIHRDPEYGNEILHLSVPLPVEQPLEVAVEYRALLLGPRQTSANSPLKPKELPRYLQPQGLLIIDDEVRVRAGQAVAGRMTLLEKARGIYEYVIRHMTYDKKTPGYGRGDTARACQVGKGNCTDFHSLFISMARAEQIPSRFKIGFLVPPEPSGTIPGYHCWAEFYEREKGWVPVDASEAWKHPELVDYYFGARDGNRLLISTGRVIRLVPDSAGGPVNIFFYPYVEVDGKSFDGVKTEFRFQELGAHVQTG